MSFSSLFLFATAVPSLPAESVTCVRPRSATSAHRKMKVEGAVGISCDDLAQLLSCSDGASTLVLDCRPFMAYNQGHVVDAVNVHCPPILKRRSGGFVALENIVPCPGKRDRLQKGCFANVVLYDEATDDLAGAVAEADSNLYSVLKSLLQQVDLSGNRVFYLVGGYQAFCEECPLLCVTHEFTIPRAHTRLAENCALAKDEQPVEILPHLLLGNVMSSSCRERLQSLGVTALVNVSTGCANHFEADFRYLNIPVNDNASADLTMWFATANEFIDSVQREGGRVLVHCHAGRSRSVTVCLAYLMRTYGWALDAAFEHVRARRDVIDPNLNFMRQLQDYRRCLDSACVSTSTSTSKSSPVAVSLSSPAAMDASSSVASSPAPGHQPLSPGVAAFEFPSAGAAAAVAVMPSAEAAPLPGRLAEVGVLPEVTPPPASPSDIQCYFTFSAPGFSFPRASLAMRPLTLPS